MFTTSLVTALLLAVPSGWHAWRASPRIHATCDPVTLMVVGSQRPRLGPGGWRAPRRGQVLVAVEVDHVNGPAGVPTRPRRFRIRWSHLQPLEGCCGTPAAPGAVFWFRERRHVLGLLVFAGRGVPPARRRATERMLDSLSLR